MNPFNLLKNTKELQEKLEQITGELQTISVEGVSGGGLVKIRLDNTQMQSIEIDPIAVDNRDIPMLQDLIRSAYNNASEKLRQELQSKLGPFAAAMNLQ